MLQRRLKLQTGGGDHQPQRGIGQRHPLHVDKRQQQRSSGREPLFAAEDNTRDQRIHRQHARREGDTDTYQQRP